ncbi:MAG: hypothetical protein UT41_C0002G0129 [Candidatus Wolfebacteria bacterium GW2011_GWC2_39_22]|uniref:Uncharacterized protein n=2 Tax=Candidatus Wolfeibacteriota TaxID=1752735 RepID=A0A0G1H9P8_9BACT|nr:MAG: hypothetical protein UT41_C0002G0129 [Candidatus Wolfebacteria bacterium GW2011_GWC2_39_22]KKT43263.1 MAG: hypothetical protein UW32_C0002G0124 [Candidatus Wolfebacteria bacterium GW2011_GWE2_44_13]
MAYFHGENEGGCHSRGLLRVRINTPQAFRHVARLLRSLATPSQGGNPSPPVKYWIPASAGMTVGGELAI